MAFLFGSWAAGKGRVDSDVDIAVYFRLMTLDKRIRGRLRELQDSTNTSE